MFDNEIASAVTAAGRAIIEFTRKYVESKGYKVKYGDSVAGDSLINVNGKGFGALYISQSSNINSTERISRWVSKR
jgi:hypothetical protein